MAYKSLPCPLCGKRACDISTFPKEKMYVSVKCPNCHKSVRIPCVKTETKPKQVAV